MSALKRYERLCEGSLGGKKSALAWEASWHVLFGADPCLCKRADVAPHAVAVKYGARTMREADDAWLGHCSAAIAAAASIRRGGLREAGESQLNFAEGHVARFDLRSAELGLDGRTACCRRSRS